MIQNFKKNTFLSNVMKLMSGTILAQAIGILISPVITRLYSPVDMGVLASLVAITSIFGVVATGRYELAIVIPDDDKEATALAMIGILIALSLGIVLSITFIIFGGTLLPLLGLNKLPFLMTSLIGFLVFLTGLQNVLTRTSIRDRRYTVLASTQVSQTISTNLVKLILGYAKTGAIGLFLGTITGQLARSVRLLWDQRRRFFIKYNWPSLVSIKTVAKRYRKFPLVDIWTSLLNITSSQLPVILFASLFSPAVAGAYALSNGILQLPMAVIGGSVGDVFLERAAKEKTNIIELARITLGIYKKLLLIGSIVLSIVTFYGDLLFPFIFGDKWLEAGRYSQWISIWVLFQFSISPLSSIFTVLEKLGEDLLWNVLLFIIRIGSLVLAFAVLGDEYSVIVLYSLAGSMFYLLYAIRVFSIVKINIKSIFKSIIILPFGIFLLQGTIAVILRSIFL